MKTVHEFVDGDCPVKLEQSTRGKFRVTYGAEVHADLNYAIAAKKYGYCVFHSLACAGKLNNGAGD